MIDDDPPIDWSKMEEATANLGLESTPLEKTGNRAFCYICNMNLRKESDMAARRIDCGTSFITVCVWCNADYLQVDHPG